MRPDIDQLDETIALILDTRRAWCLTGGIAGEGGMYVTKLATKAARHLQGGRAGIRSAHCALQTIVDVTKEHGEAHTWLPALNACRALL